MPICLCYTCFCISDVVRLSHVSLFVVFFFFKQKTAYEMRISDWSSDVCSSDLKSTAVWTARPSDPGLEAEFLSRLMARLSGEERQETKQAVQNAQMQAPRAKLVKDAGGNYLQVDEGFERAWRRVGVRKSVV